MIKYNSNDISDWNLGDSNLIKVYRHNAICYYKVVAGETAQTPCYAVVNDITQYQDTEFENVFNKADNKWYKLNNINEYEEYGVYGSGRTITTYDGKLTIDDGFEYQYSGNSWTNLGEVSGSSRVPQGYTEVEYITSENISSAVTGPYIDTNFTPNQNTRVVLDYQPIVNNQENRRIFGSGRFNNTSSGNYIWSMEGKLGKSSCKFYYKFDNGGSSWSTTSVVPDLNRHVVDFNREGKIWLDDTAIVTLPNNTVNCSYHLGIFNEIGSGMEEGVKECLLGRVYSCKIYDNGTLVRDFVPCIRTNGNVVGLYDSINGVFYDSARNEYQFGAGAETGGTIVYPVYYDEIQDPPTQVSFSSMTEAEQYECPYVGLMATINGDLYIFNDNYKWELIPRFEGKWKATYTGGTVSSASCDSSSAITENEIAETGLESVVIGDCVTSISYNAFKDCNSLTSINIPSGVTSIGNSAFQGCTSLSSITILDSVTSIGNFAFNNCTSLTSCTISIGVTSIGSFAFYGCSGLTSITVEAATPPSLGSMTFNNTNNCPIYVPSQSVETYKATSGWSSYASRIQAIP